MSAYGNNEFVREFARRTLANLRDINGNRTISYDDTAMIGMLLAVFVLPNERIADKEFMAKVLQGYDKQELGEVIKVLRPEFESGKSLPKDFPQSFEEIPRFLRHSIAHLNIRPVSGDEHKNTLTHLLVWNENPHTKKITFVAQLHLRKLRKFAEYVLSQIETGNAGDKWEDVDPLTRFDAQSIKT